MSGLEISYDTDVYAKLLRGEALDHPTVRVGDHRATADGTADLAKHLRHLPGVSAVHGSGGIVNLRFAPPEPYRLSESSVDRHLCSPSNLNDVSPGEYFSPI